MVWDFVTVGDPRLAAAAPFYGTVPAGVDFSRNRAAVLGVYGDTRRALKIVSGQRRVPRCRGA